jgi:phosphatidylinositol alpha 1,6-mannosyltransferase
MVGRSDVKILHICKKYPDALGGDAIVVESLERRQREAGHDVTIVTSNCKDTRREEHVITFGLRDDAAALDAITVRRLLSLVGLFFRSFGVLRKEAPDIIHTHAPEMAFVVSLVARIYRIPIVHSIHIMTFNDPKQPLIRRKSELALIRGASPQIVLTSNPSSVADLRAAGVGSAELLVHGVDPDEWASSKGAGANGRPFTFLAVGRLEEQKGFHHLVEAVAHLRSRPQPLSFSVQIAGQGSLRGELDQFIETSGVADVVSLVGRKSRSDLRELFASADALVVPSLWESGPLVVLEAWASSLPVIGTRVGAMPFLAENGGIVLVEPGNSEELAVAMADFLDHPDLCAELARCGHAQVIHDLTWSAVAERVAVVYRRAIQSVSRPPTGPAGARLRTQVWASRRG